MMIDFNLPEDRDTKEEFFIHRKSGIIFCWQEKIQCYEPIAYDVEFDEEGNIEAKNIEKGDIYYHFIVYIRNASDVINKSTGEKVPGFLDIYQWDIAFKIIQCAISLRSEDKTSCSL